MTDKFGTLIEWLKQPSTLKFIVTAAGGLGIYLDPGKVQEIILGILGASAVINGFYDNSTKKSKVPTAAELNAILTSDVIVELVRLRKAKIAADKTVTETSSK